MKKTLVILTHPDIEKSVINKRWVEELEKYPERFTIHNLHLVYPDGTIDVAKEQKLVESHENLVFQFPLYWFNCPPLLKKWLDDVLTYGWAYGKSGDKLKNKKVALAVTAGIKEDDYTDNGKYHITLKQLLSPFEVTFFYVNADYKSFFAFYGAEDETPAAVVEKNAQEYIAFLNTI